MSLEIINFKSEYAQKYGMLEAVIMWQIHYFLTHAKANKEKYHDGKFWTFNSVRAWQEQLPFATYKQIKTALNKLRKLGVIIVGKFNKRKYDKTLWYSLSDNFFNHSLVPVGPKDCPCRANGKALEGQPIPKESSKELSKEVESTATNVYDSATINSFNELIFGSPFDRIKNEWGLNMMLRHFNGDITRMQSTINKLFKSYSDKNISKWNKSKTDLEREFWSSDAYSYIENSILKELKK